MTDDRPLSDADLPSLTPAEEERVRLLLADARETGPMPADVATRLDDVLADLRASATTTRASRPADEGARPREERSVVVPLSRWRGRLAGGLVAAAAVVLGLVVVPQLGLSGDDGGESTSASSSESDEATDDTASGQGLAPQAEGAPTDAGPPEMMTGKSQAGADLATASRAELRRTARELRTERPARFQGSDSAPCGTPAADARIVVVRYAGADAALVYSPPANGRQRVELWTCPGPEVVETLRLRAP